MTNVLRGWRPLPHTADAGVEAWARSLEDLYAVAAEGLFGSMGEPETLVATPAFEQKGEGIDAEDLLVRLLSDLVSGFAVDGRYVERAQALSLTRHAEWAVTLHCVGGRVDRDRERGLTEVKAVTYHGVEVAERAGVWTARYYVDL